MKKIDNIYIKRIGYFNLYVIKGEDGDILIDTGFILMKKRLKKWLDKFDIKLIILTHAHVDHIWNTAYIKKLYNCDVAIGKFDVNNIDNSNIKSKANKKRYKTWTKLMNFGMRRFKANDFEIEYYLEDEENINKYGINLNILHLPGHTDGSIGIIYKNYLFCGDALVNRRIKRAEMPYQNQNNDTVIDSIKKIINLSPEIIFVGHDRPIKNRKLLKSFVF